MDLADSDDDEDDEEARRIRRKMHKKRRVDGDTLEDLGKSAFVGAYYDFSQG